MMFSFLLSVSSASELADKYMSNLCVPGGMIGETVHFLPDWYLLSALALFASAFILLFVYLLSHITNSSKYKSIVKLNAYELVASVVIIITIMALNSVYCSLKVGSFIPGGFLSDSPVEDSQLRDLNLFAYEIYYFTDVSDTIMWFIRLTNLAAIQMDIAASATLYAKPLGVGVITNPVGGIGFPLKQLLYNSITAMVVAFILNESQLAVVKYALVGFTGFFIPFGLFLRSFLPTRRIGGTLIAIGISFLFIYPIVLVLSGILVNFGAASFSTYIDISSFQQELEGSLKDFAIQTKEGNSWKSVSGLFSGLWNVITYPFKLFFSGFGTAFKYAVLAPMSLIGFVFLVGYFLPAVNVLILSQAARYFSRLIGEEVDITTLLRLI